MYTISDITNIRIYYSFANLISGITGVMGVPETSYGTSYEIIHSIPFHKKV
jgi:hypothetical protein